MGYQPNDNPAGDTKTKAVTPETRKRSHSPMRAARLTISVLPTLLTLGNLLCGFAAIFFASRPADTLLPLGWTPLAFSASMVFLGMVFDGLDGRIARLTHNTTDLGEQLDSMADMVTFGVAPAFLAVQVIGVDTPFVSATNDLLFDRVVVVVASIYVACSALRLARFNIEIGDADQADHTSFRGLPSPGAAGTVASMVLFQQHFLVHQPDLHKTLVAVEVVLVVIVLLSALAMVSRLQYVHVINRYVRGRAKFGTVAKAVVIALLLLINLQGAIAAGFVVYSLSGPTGWVLRKLSRGSNRSRGQVHPN